MNKLTAAVTLSKSADELTEIPARTYRTALRLMARFLKPLILPLVLFGIWVTIAASHVVGTIFVPAPWHVASEAWLIRSNLVHGLGVSMKIIAIGFAIGGSAGVLAGLLLGFSRHVRDLFELTLDIVRPIPLFALIPLFVLWFGIGTMPEIALIGLGMFLIMSLTTIEAIRNVPQIYVRAALTCGADRVAVYRSVVVPAIVPHMLTGLRFAVAAAWGLDVAAEYTGSQSGLGYIMIVREQILDTAGIIVIVIIYCALAIFFDRMIRYATLHVARWSERSIDRGLVREMLGGG